MTDFPLLKDMIDRQLVQQIADRVSAVYPSFARSEFVAANMVELDGLELKARTRLIAEKLREFLPASYPEALEILLAVINDERGFPPIDNGGLRLMAIPAFVELYGVGHPEASLDAMPVITRVSSCEFAIRPLLIHHQEFALGRVRSWAVHDDENVRRLASEGSRPRLPWGARLGAFIDDPSPNLALLERLKDDPSLYVRRSVANHLNDIGKDHPDLLLERMEAWKTDASAERKWLIRHALRSLVKRGDARALAILGFAQAQVALEALHLKPSELRFGGELLFAFQLRSTGDEVQNLLVDYVMHFRKANGKTAPKVFKLKTLQLAAGETAVIEKRMSIRPISTRRYYAGQQRLEIQVNGRVLGGADFELVMD